MNNFDDLFEQQPQAEAAPQKQESQKERPKRQWWQIREEKQRKEAYVCLLYTSIDQEILDYCVQTGRIYESRNKGHSNVVFVGFDKDGKARFGCLRGISEDVYKRQAPA